MGTKSISRHVWVENLRFVSKWLVWSIGSFACLALLVGLLSGPPSPPVGASYEEHLHRVDSGYYTARALEKLAVTMAYLLVFSIPHRWLIRSKVRAIPTIVILALPLFAHLGGIITAFVHRWPDRTTFIFVSVVDTLYILFFLLAPSSLFFSWKFQKKDLDENLTLTNYSTE